MREIQVYPPTKQNLSEVVRRLEFRANGGELVAWCGSDVMSDTGRRGDTRALHVYDFATDSARELDAGELFANAGSWCDECTPDPVLSPDGRILAYEVRAHDSQYLNFVPVPADEQTQWPITTVDFNWLRVLAFVPGRADLIAVQTNDDWGELTYDIARCDAAPLLKPPKRFEDKVNPLNGEPFRLPVYDLRWRPVTALPAGERPATASASADGRLIAVGGVTGGLHVVSLKRRGVLRSFPWDGRKGIRDRAAVRVEFSPDAKWVVMLANGRLFARPLGAGTAWQTKGTLGYVHDFAFHPSGRVLCAVFADGQARHLSPFTGAVVQAFKWARAKKPQPLYSVCFAPDGLTCAAGGNGGKVVIWDVDA